VPMTLFLAYEDQYRKFREISGENQEPLFVRPSCEAVVVAITRRHFAHEILALLSIVSEYPKVKCCMTSRLK